MFTLTGARSQGASHGGEVTGFQGVISEVDSLRIWLNDMVKKQAVPSKSRMTLRVTSPDGKSYYAGYDGRTGQEVTDFSQIVEIGSCSKVFTSTAIHQLIERGQFGLEDPLVDILEEPALLEGLMATDSADYLQEVRLKHLLNHTSGMPEYFLDSDEMELAVFGDSTLRFTPRQLVRMANRVHDPQFRPGERFKYTNTNYILLGLILEKHTGLPYQEVIRQKILNPAGLTETYFASLDSPEKRAPGFWKGEPTQMPPTLAGAAGEMLSTLDDMDRFLRYWYGGSFFSDPGYMEGVRNEAYHSMGMPGVDYGLGLLRLMDSYGHGGQTFSFQSYMGILPNGWSFVFAIDDAAVPAWGPAMALSSKLKTLD
ncbi:MAG: serine hydrolase domain-containing protein [Robiginitalea sp.]|nr:serine hydrolase domain-containing protein [Robiginitalea sp.]